MFNCFLYFYSTGGDIVQGEKDKTKEREIKNERDNNKERKLMHESGEENWREK